MFVVRYMLWIILALYIDLILPLGCKATTETKEIWMEDEEDSGARFVLKLGRRLLDSGDDIHESTEASRIVVFIVVIVGILVVLLVIRWCLKVAQEDVMSLTTVHPPPARIPSGSRPLAPPRTSSSIILFPEERQYEASRSQQSVRMPSGSRPLAPPRTSRSIILFPEERQYEALFKGLQNPVSYSSTSSNQPLDSSAATNRDSNSSTAFNRTFDSSTAINQTSDSTTAINRAADSATVMNRGYDFFTASSRAFDFSTPSNVAFDLSSPMGQDRTCDSSTAINQASYSTTAINRASDTSTVNNRSSYSSTANNRAFDFSMPSNVAFDFSTSMGQEKSIISATSLIDPPPDYESASKETKNSKDAKDEPPPKYDFT